MPDLKVALQAAQRGNNLVCYAPPSPNALRELLAVVTETEGLKVALAAESSVDEWARVASRVSEGRHVAAGHTPARLARLLASSELRLLIVTPELALELVRRATLKLEKVSALLLLWPDSWSESDRELLATLLQDLDKSVQRILVSSDSEASAPIVERYCWRAAVVDLLGPMDAVDVPVRSMPVAWSRRYEAVSDLLDQLDPEKFSIWHSDSSNTEVSDLVVAVDLPSPTQLRELAAAGPVVLLVPPGTESYVARLAPKRRPIEEQTALRAADKALAKSRRAIADLVDAGVDPSSYSALAPLLERYESSRVAAALYELWQASSSGSKEPEPRAAAPTRGTKLWLGIGKRDSVTPNDLVGALIKQAGVPREAVGKVEIRESFSLVELGAGADPAAAAERLAGTTVKGRRLVARLDRGRTAKT